MRPLPRDRSAAPPPPSRVCPPAGGEGCGPKRGCYQARHVPYLPALICHAPPEGEPRHPHRPGATRPPGRQHHDDLHPRPQPRPRSGPKSRRPDAPLMGLRRPKYRVPGMARYSATVSPYIIPHGAGGLLQGGTKSGVQRVRSDRFSGIYRTMQFDNAVQDTERWAAKKPNSDDELEREPAKAGQSPHASIRIHEGATVSRIPIANQSRTGPITRRIAFPWLTPQRS